MEVPAFLKEAAENGGGAFGGGDFEGGDFGGGGDGFTGGDDDW